MVGVAPAPPIRQGEQTRAEAKRASQLTRRPAQQAALSSAPREAAASSGSGRAQSTLLLFECPFRSSTVEMEPPCRPKALQKLRERLCTETEPRQLYKTLKKLSSQPMLGDILEEIGFRQTIKLLRKQQLLVPFAKALASQ